MNIVPVSRIPQEPPSCPFDRREKSYFIKQKTVRQDSSHSFGMTNDPRPLAPPSHAAPPVEPRSRRTSVSRSEIPPTSPDACRAARPKGMWQCRRWSIHRRGIPSCRVVGPRLCKAERFFVITFNGVGNFFAQTEEKIGLTEHRADTAHLKHEPLNQFVALAHLLRKKLAGLFRQVHQDGARLEQRQRLPPGPSVSIMEGILLFGLTARYAGVN